MSEDELQYRRAVVTSFALEAGKMLGYIIAHYPIISQELPIQDLFEALEKIRSHSHSKH